MATSLSIKSGSKQLASPTNVFITLNAIVVSLLSGNDAFYPYSQKPQFWYYPNDSKSIPFVERGEMKKARSILSLPPKPYAINVIKQLADNKRFELYFLFPIYNSTHQADFEKMRDWFLKNVGEGFKKKVLLTNNYDMIDGGIFIEHNHSLLLNGFTGSHFRIGSENCRDWQTVQSALFEPQPLLDKFRMNN